MINARTRRKLNRTLLFAIVLFLALAFLVPFAFVSINSLKPLGDIIRQPLSLPKGAVDLENFVKAWEVLEFPKVLKNTMLLTVGSVLGILWFSALNAYWLIRHPTPFSKVFEALLTGSLLVPFAVIMIPLVKTLRVFHLTNSLWGGIISYWGVGMALSTYVMRGAVKAIPIEIEEAAYVDGCNVYQVFFKIVFPLLRPTMLSVFILEVFWIWNDYLLPVVLLNNNKLLTIPLAIKRMFGLYSNNWDLATSGLVMSIIPILIVYVFLQKRIISGIVSGAIKG
jgi:raffinose/stachyose/melibiose transport system permease protein